LQNCKNRNTAFVLFPYIHQSNRIKTVDKKALTLPYGKRNRRLFQGCSGDPRVVGRCDHLLSDILLIALCTYLSGGSDYQDMCLFGKERGNQLKGIILRLANGHPKRDVRRY